MNNTYKEAFSEVLEVLKNSNPNIVKKIPTKFISFLKENKDNNYIVNIDFTNECWENSIKQETQDILALVYRDYLVTPQKREELLKEEAEEEKKKEQELREKYNPDNLFKIDSKKQIEINDNREIQIIEYKQTFFNRFIDFIKRLVLKKN